MDFTLPSGPGYTVTINEDGLSKLTLNGALLGEGINTLLDGGWFYKPFDPAGYIPTLDSKSSTPIPNGVAVHHVYSGVVNAIVDYEYTVSGNDVHVKALVFNTGAQPLQPAFRSMRFLPWSGGYTIGLGYNQDNTQSEGKKLSYPSSNVPFSASAISTTVGGSPLNFSVWSEEDPHEKFMQLAVGVAPNAGYAVTNIFFPEVPPEGCRVYRFAFRFMSSSTNWRELLEGYKNHLRGVLPTILYEPDARPLVSFTAISTSYIRQDNPYGYGDGGDNITRRFDKLDGCADYVAKLVGPMIATGYQGIVMWQLQGIHSRGIQYRPDFNSFPAATLPNLPTLTAGFNAAGLTIGLQARPGIAATSGGDWDHDNPIRLSDGDGTNEDLNWRIDWALSAGFKGFYLDSFINLGIDHNILKFIRSKVGTAHTFCEFSTALSMAYSAAYEVVPWSGGIQLSLRQQILRWLWPESIVATFVTDSPAYSELYPAMFALKLTPWVEDYRVWQNNAENAILQPLVDSYISPDGRWLDMALTTSLVAFFEFQDDWSDSVGGAALTPINTPTFAAGKVGQAASFAKASQQYAGIADNPTFSMGAGVRFTIAGWWQPGAAVGAKTGLAKANAAGNFEYFCAYANPVGPVWQFFVSSDGTALTSVSGSVAPSPGVWAFLVHRYDGTNISISVNGGAFVDTAFSADCFNGNSTFCVGTSIVSLATESFDGLADQVGVWKRALTDPEVATLYNGGNGLSYAQMVALSSSGGSMLLLGVGH